MQERASPSPRKTPPPAGLLLLVALAGALLPLPVSPAAAPDPAAQALTPHDPIVIQSDADLLLPDAVSGNGVVGGTGTEDDPLLIRGWEIPFTQEQPAILIVDTHLHVRIEDARVVGPPDDWQGSAMAVGLGRNAGSFVIHGLEVATSGDALIRVLQTTLRVENSHLQNATIDATEVTLAVEDSTLTHSFQFKEGIDCFTCDLTVVRSSFLEASIDVHGGNLHLKDVTLLGGSARVYCLPCDSTVENVTMDGPGWIGFQLVRSPDDASVHHHTFRDVRIRGKDIGIWAGGVMEARNLTFEETNKAIHFGGESLSVQGFRMVDTRQDSGSSTNPDGIAIGHSNFSLRDGYFGEGLEFGVLVYQVNDESPVHGEIEQIAFKRAGRGVVVRTLWAGDEEELAPVSIRVHNSTFTGTQTAAVDTGDSTAVVDARWTWWGSPEGPVVGESQGLRAGVLGGNVTFEPWITTPPPGVELEEAVDRLDSPLPVATGIVGLLATGVLARRRRGRG